jgi:gliding motility-associated-like protein
MLWSAALLCPVALLAAAPCPRNIALAGSATVCAQGNAGQVFLTPSDSLRVEVWMVSDNAGFNGYAEDYATKATSYPYSNLPQSRYYRVTFYDSACQATDTKGIAAVQVTPMSAAGEVLGGAEHCAGAASGQLQLSDYVGKVVGWQVREEGAGWRDVPQSAVPALPYADLGQTTLYRGVVQNGVCPAVASDSVCLKINPAPTAAFSVAGACLGEASLFADASAVGEGWIADRAWSFGDGASSTLQHPRHTYLNAALYTATLRVASSKGCAGQASQEVRVHALPKADFSAEAACVGFPNAFASTSVVASAEALRHLWRFEDGATSTLANPQHTFAGHGSRRAQLVVQSEAGGCKDSVEKSATVYPPPLASAGRDTVVELGFGAALQASGGLYYRWSDAPGMSAPHDRTPLVAPTATTMYVVEVEDEHGCVASDSVTVGVKATQRITPSTLVTPDGNGENDTWTVRNIESYPDAQVRVLNARGVTVLSCTGYRNDWNVSSPGGAPLPEGTYYYIITFKDTGKVYKGAITVLRGK